MPPHDLYPGLVGLSVNQLTHGPAQRGVYGDQVDPGLGLLMRRRAFIMLLGGAAAMALLQPLALAQQADDRVRDLVGRILRMQAEAAAGTIGQFLGEIQGQIGWTTQLSWSTSTI